MQEVSIHEAKTHLSRLIKDVEAGESIVIKRGNLPVARLVPLEKIQSPRTWGQEAGNIIISNDFDAPLPPDLLQFFQA